jgi:hypothetical protein
MASPVEFIQGVETRMSGWLRIYLVATVLWVGWFGYELYDANHQRARALDYMQTCKNAYALHQLCAYDLNELGQDAGEQLRREQISMKALPVIPVGLPIVFLVVLWVLRGFRSASKKEE